jgi:preprotein translocase subunit SecY
MPTFYNPAKVTVTEGGGGGPSIGLIVLAVIVAVIVGFAREHANGIDETVSDILNTILIAAGVLTVAAITTVILVIRHRRRNPALTAGQVPTRVTATVIRPMAAKTPVPAVQAPQVVIHVLAHDPATLAALGLTPGAIADLDTATPTQAKVIPGHVLNPGRATGKGERS